MTNDEWLTYVTHNDIPALNAWLNSEHVETPNATSHGDTAALDAKIAALTAELDSARRDRETYREKFSKCLDYADAIHALMDEGLA